MQKIQGVPFLFRVFCHGSLSPHVLHKCKDDFGFFPRTLENIVRRGVRKFKQRRQNSTRLLQSPCISTERGELKPSALIVPGGSSETVHLQDPLPVLDSGLTSHETIPPESQELLNLRARLPLRSSSSERIEHHPPTRRSVIRRMWCSVMRSPGLTISS